MANFTKQAIKASFMKLLSQKPLNKISVRDIVEDCGINRNSFYYHFQDIPSLLGEIVTEQTDQLINGSGHISLVVHSGTHSGKQMGIDRFNDFFVCQVKSADKSCLQL